MGLPRSPTASRRDSGLGDATMTRIRIGVIGDLHSHWDQADVAHFERTDYDLLLFTGDLGGGTPESSLRMAKVMSRLRKDTLVMPGNNDTGDIAELSAELAHQSGIKSLLAIRDGSSVTASGGGTPPVRLCGYSQHRLTREHVDLTLIAARPHSLGGSELSFPEHMEATYGITSIAASTERLFGLVDESATRDIVFLSHNGPTGLGDEPHSMWGCDFKPDGGDWGDPDLAATIDYAIERGKRVIAVIAGHMHHRTKCGNERPWRLERDGIVYINAAKVPRIYSSGADVHRHHVSLEITSSGANASEVLVRG
jgi:uncharacterized protein (TIGR04168 family)